MRTAQLTEQHSYKLVPTRKSLRHVLRSGLLDDHVKFMARNKLVYLTEHAARCVHIGPPSARMGLTIHPHRTPPDGSMPLLFWTTVVEYVISLVRFHILSLAKYSAKRLQTHGIKDRII